MKGYSLLCRRFFNKEWLTELPSLIRKEIESLRGLLDFVDKISMFVPYPDYSHIGESIYCTVQKRRGKDMAASIGINHNLRTYREALQ